MLSPTESSLQANRGFFSSSKLQTLSLSSHKPSPNTQAVHIRCVTATAPFLITAFSSCCNKMPNKSSSRVYLECRLKVGPSWWGSHGGRNMRHLATLHAQSGSRAEWTLVLSWLSFLLIPGAQSMEWCCPFSVQIFSSLPNTSQVYSLYCLLDNHLLCQVNNQY